MATPPTRPRFDHTDRPGTDTPTSPAGNARRHTRFFLISLLLVVLATIGIGCLLTPDGDRLSGVEHWVRTSYPNVPQLAADDAEHLRTQQPDTLVFDVREPAEYAVSHLPGAIQVSPSTSADDFIRQFGKQAQGKHVLFYCTVGRRASRLADRVAHRLKAENARPANIVGGIFRWHADRLPLVDNDGQPTRAVHTYSRLVGELLPPERPEIPADSLADRNPAEAAKPDSTVTTAR